MIIYIKMKMRILSFSKGLLVANSFIYKHGIENMY